MLEVVGPAEEDSANAGSSNTPLKMCFDVEGTAGEP